MNTVSRRSLLAAMAAACSRDGAAHGSGKPLRLGLTPVFLDHQVAFLAQWRQYLEARTQRSVQFVQRGSYREVVALLQQGQIDFAWLCGYPYVRHAAWLRLLAVPLFGGQPLYRSYLIASAASHDVAGLRDLRGKVFAYSDPDSNSGWLYTQYTLLAMREPPTTFFARSFFTWGHRKVVDAVGVGLAHGGAVDGYVWDTLSRELPALTARTRIVERSPSFGFPPVVARAGVAGSEFALMQSVLLGMAGHADGRSLLKRLNIDGFVVGAPALYDGVRAMSRQVDAA